MSAEEMGSDNTDNKNMPLIDSEAKEIGIKVREARKGKDWTQKELAERAGLSQQAISFIENGYSNISLMTFKKIADVLGLKISIGVKNGDPSSTQTYTSEL